MWVLRAWRVVQTCTLASSSAKAEFAGVSSRLSSFCGNAAIQSDAAHQAWKGCVASAILKRAIITTTGTVTPLAGRGLTGLPNTSCASASASFRWVCSTTPANAGPGARGPRTSKQVLQEGRSKSSDQALYLTAVVVGMVGITYLSVPLYRMFCQATGFGGTVQRTETVEEKIRNRTEEEERAAAERSILVEFNADVTDGMPWKFRPTQRAVRVKPGESALAFYTAHNTSDQAITGISTYNVTPQAAGVYFNKIQCFCFEEQKLRPGEKIDMPVFFYIDPEFALDPRLKGVDNLTLSYTFFEVEEGKEYPQLPQPGQAIYRAPAAE